MVEHQLPKLNTRVRFPSSAQNRFSQHTRAASRFRERPFHMSGSLPAHAATAIPPDALPTDCLVLRPATPEIIVVVGQFVVLDSGERVVEVVQQRLPVLVGD